MSAKTPLPEPEFSQPLAVDKIPAAGLVKTLEVDEAARRRIAARFDLLDLPRLHADLTIQSARAGKAYEVKGRFVADVVQKCGVTNEPVPDHIEGDIDVLYTTETAEEGAQIFVDPSAAEIEALADGVIDIGELVVQNFGVALNPYPRKPGAVFEGAASDEKASPMNPLAKIAQWTGKAKDKPEG